MVPISPHPKLDAEALLAEFERQVSISVGQQPVVARGVQNSDIAGGFEMGPHDSMGVSQPSKPMGQTTQHRCSMQTLSRLAEPLPRHRAVDDSSSAGAGSWGLRCSWSKTPQNRDTSALKERRSKHRIEPGCDVGSRLIQDHRLKLQRQQEIREAVLKQREEDELAECQKPGQMRCDTSDTIDRLHRWGVQHKQLLEQRRTAAMRTADERLCREIRAVPRVQGKIRTIVDNTTIHAQEDKRTSVAVTASDRLYAAGKEWTRRRQQLNGETHGVVMHSTQSSAQGCGKRARTPAARK